MEKHYKKKIVINLKIKKLNMIYDILFIYHIIKNILSIML